MHLERNLKMGLLLRLQEDAGSGSSGSQVSVMSTDTNEQAVTLDGNGCAARHVEMQRL